MNKISNFQFLQKQQQQLFFSTLDHEVLEEGFINSKADAESRRSVIHEKGVICMQ